jgi:hypothetical protein
MWKIAATLWSSRLRGWFDHYNNPRIGKIMRDFIDASDALIAVLRAFMLGTAQRDYRIPSIALDAATRRYDAAKAALVSSGLETPT